MVLNLKRNCCQIACVKWRFIILFLGLKCLVAVHSCVCCCISLINRRERINLIERVLSEVQVQVKRGGSGSQTKDEDHQSYLSSLNNHFPSVFSVGRKCTGAFLFVVFNATRDFCEDFISQSGWNIEGIKTTFFNTKARKGATFRQGKIYLTLQEFSWSQLLIFKVCSDTMLSLITHL